MRGASVVGWVVGVALVGLATGCEQAIAVTTWTATAAEHRDEVGRVITVVCPSGGQIAEAWGTDLYTDDSSICTAAAHAGLITLEEGGEVTFEIRGGASAYRGSVRNGIATGELGAWENAFAFVKKK